MGNWNLSEKIWYAIHMCSKDINEKKHNNEGQPVLPLISVKEFIKRLKALSIKKNEYYSAIDNKYYLVIPIEDINKLAGSKIIKYEEKK